ncbi:hypothetical protein CCR75_006667 [Bremia lactucae]|uniref:Palmitoyltransferase n=1 Tax=Bremia lactucae TaxID=4779 RepID=A0A976FL73_BRELC|nr:hypothetical protein CCR75_006667 [Bremia lactucae]
MQTTMLGVVTRVRDYVFYERNPLVQILYFATTGSCYYLYLREAHPLLPNKFVAWFHKWLATLLFVVSIALYVVMCTKDPGVIRHYHDRNIVGYVTTALADSTIIWFNGCVGEKNYKYFLAYLLAQLVVCLEGFFVTTSVFYTQTEDLLRSRGVSMEVVGRTETAKIMQSLIANNQGLGIVTAMSFLAAIILWVFLLMQLKRIAQNETANESFKREDLREEADLDGETSGRRMFRFLFKRLSFQKRPKMVVPRRELKKALDATWGGLFSPDAIMNTEESFSLEDVNFNPYKLGSFKHNLFDALNLRLKQKSR